ncbi:hypothetical protein AB0N24_20725 [Arthrobacter sp. NPDC093128]|uniref:hypothetical protein n=1 Tax=Arthrobacter sp. NPDC093128 TaxID=3154979 RepID=UPI00342014C0
MTGFKSSCQLNLAALSNASNHDNLIGHSQASAADSAKALRTSIALFARLGRRIADGLGFPPFNHDRVHSEVEAILAMRPDAR